MGNVRTFKNGDDEVGRFVEELDTTPGNPYRAAGLLSGVGVPEACPDCEQMLIIGSWPFCKSKHNPQGHAPRTEVAYGWHFA